jgi:hypothetical protein
VLSPNLVQRLRHSCAALLTSRLGRLVPYSSASCVSDSAQACTVVRAPVFQTQCSLAVLAPGIAAPWRAFSNPGPGRIIPRRAILLILVFRGNLRECLRCSTAFAYAPLALRPSGPGRGLSFWASEFFRLRRLPFPDPGSGPGPLLEFSRRRASLATWQGNVRSLRSWGS